MKHGVVAALLLALAACAHALRTPPPLEKIAPPVLQEWSSMSCTAAPMRVLRSSL